MGKGTAICIGRTVGTSVQWAAMETYRECCHCYTHTPLPLQRWEATNTKSFCFTFLSLVDQCGYDQPNTISTVYVLMQHRCHQRGPPYQHHSEARKMAKQSLPDIHVYPSPPDPHSQHQNYGYAVMSTQLYLSMPPCTIVPYSS